MNRELAHSLAQPDRSEIDVVSLIQVVETIDFEQLARGEKLDVDEAYATYMNDRVDCENPSAFVLISDDEFLFDGKPYRVVGKEMTAYMCLLLHQRHGKIDLAMLEKLDMFPDDMTTYQAQNGMLRKLQTTTAAISGTTYQHKLTGQPTGFGTKLHRIRDDCVVFDERESYAAPENASELQELQARAKEIMYKPTQPRVKKELGNTALEDVAVEPVSEFPFNKVETVNLAEQLKNFLTGKSDDFPVITYDPTTDAQTKRVIREAFGADDQPEDFQLRLKLINDQIIELRSAS